MSTTLDEVGVKVHNLTAADLEQEQDFAGTVGDFTSPNPRMVCRDVNVWYDDKQAIRNVSLDIGRNEVVSMIGPSGCGKSTFLRCLNRMNDTIPAARVERLDYAGRAGDPGQGHRRGAAARARRHGVPEAEPVPEVDLRERRLRSAHSWPVQQPRRAGRAGRD